MTSARTAVILVEPQHPGNIGMVCRAMANFGVGDLRLVRPCPFQTDEARQLAVGAASLLSAAQVYPDLESALSDRTLTLAATRRQGKYRHPMGSIAALNEILAPYPPDVALGLVFGRERSGLTLTETEQCSGTVTIPTHEPHGSLNLAQAVLLFLYELDRSRPMPAPADARVPADREQSEALLRQIEGVLTRVAYLNPRRPQTVMTPLRRLLQRALPDAQEVNLMRGLLRQVDDSLHDWPRARRGQSKQETDPASAEDTD